MIKRNDGISAEDLGSNAIATVNILWMFTDKLLDMKAYLLGSCR